MMLIYWSDVINVYCIFLFKKENVFIFTLSPPNSVVGKGIMFMGCPSVAFVCSPGQILLPRYLMNGLSNLEDTGNIH